MKDEEPQYQRACVALDYKPLLIFGRFVISLAWFKSACNKHNSASAPPSFAAHYSVNTVRKERTFAYCSKRTPLKFNRLARPDS